MPIGPTGIGTTIIGGTAGAGIARATGGLIPCHIGTAADKLSPVAVRDRGLWRMRFADTRGGNKMKHRNFLAGPRKLLIATVLVTFGSALTISTSFAQSSANCRAYAEDYSLRYSDGSAWGNAFRIPGGRRGAVNAMAAERSRRLQKSTLFDNAYARCMRGRWP